MDLDLKNAQLWVRSLDTAPHGGPGVCPNKRISKYDDKYQLLAKKFNL